MKKLKDEVKTILRDEFRQVPGLTAVLYEPDDTGMALFARIKSGANLTKTSELAFEAFKDAADRLMVETPGAPYFTWYGVVQGARKDAEELKL